jgi:hypothetical protein
MMSPLKSAAGALLTGVLLVALTGCDRGPAERTGANVDRAVENAGEAIEDAGENIQDAAQGNTN